MRYTCPNLSCREEYELEAADIPSGKKGFKCQKCGTLVPVKDDTEASVASPSLVFSDGGGGTAAISPGISKTASLFLFIGVLIFLGGGGFLYMQYKSIAGGTITTANVQMMSQARQAELRRKAEELKKTPSPSSP